MIPSPISINIPKILKIGPAFFFALGVEAKVTLEGHVSFGYECNFPSISARLDPNAAKSSTVDGPSVTPGCHAIPGVGIDNLSFTITPYVKAGLGFVVQIFDSDKFNAEAAIMFKVALEVSLSNQPGCSPKAAQPDTKLAADVILSIYAAAKLSSLGGEIKIYDKTFPLFSNCEK